MKPLCLLFIIYVLILSVRPCCTDDCITKTAAATLPTSKAPQNKKECQGCSPFFSCGSCVGFVVAKRVTNTVALVAVKQVKHNSAYRHPYSKDVSLSIWQPPQLG